jgi:hypothetical protein
MPRSAWVGFHCSTRGVPATARFEETSGGWELVETVPRGAGAGTAGQVALRGVFTVSSRYRGCSTCSASSFVKCGNVTDGAQCGALGCWNYPERTWTCRRCGWSGQVGPTGIESMDVLDAG